MRQRFLNISRQQHFWLVAGALFAVLVAQAGCSAQSGPPVNWTNFDLGDPPLHLTLPDEATPMETSVPWEMINHLQRFDTYRLYYAEGKLVATFKFIQFNMPIEESNATLLDKEVADVMKLIKADQVEQQGKEIKIKSVPGRKAAGSFILDQQKWVFRDWVMQKDSSMWQVWMATREDDPALLKTLKKMEKGIKF
jgi:hypothetical protein